jgi:hypothetical protein
VSTRYRAVAVRYFKGKPSYWYGKWRTQPEPAIAQAERWVMKHLIPNTFVQCEDGRIVWSLAEDG